MDNQEVVKMIKKETASNPVLNDILHSWANRDRTRNQVTVVALAQRMEKEGFEYAAEDYGKALLILSKYGVGTIEMNRKGTRVVALRHIQVTLQSLGKAILGEGSIIKIKKRNKYKSFSPASGAVAAGPQRPYVGEDRRKKDTTKEGVYVGVYIHGKAVSIPVPDNFEAEDISYLMAKLKDGNL